VRYIPPDPSETEISVFGARKGECIVIHADGLWFVVDSFRVKSGASRAHGGVKLIHFGGLKLIHPMVQ